MKFNYSDSSKRASLAQKRERHTHARSGILNELASVLATYPVSKNRGAYFDNRVIIVIVIHRDESRPSGFDKTRFRDPLYARPAAHYDVSPSPRALSRQERGMGRRRGKRYSHTISGLYGRAAQTPSSSFVCSFVRSFRAL